MRSPKRRSLIFLVTVAAVFLLPLAAHAVTITFFNITNNNPADAGTAGQYTVDLTGAGSQATFKFMNAGPAASSITDIYFADGTLLGTMVTPITGSAGVSFSQNANPPDLPGGGEITPKFVTTAGFSADSTPPAQLNGVNPTEYVTIVFSLQSGKTFDDVVASLTDGGLRIGLHVQGFAGGGSESFVNNRVPVPPTALLLGSGLLGLGLLGWRRRRR